MSSQQSDAHDLASALCSQLRSTAADSISTAVRYLSGDRHSDAAVEAARHWMAAAELWEDAFTLLALQFGTPGDLPWLEKLAAEELAGLVQSTALAARAGAVTIRRARESLFDAVERAQQSVPEAD